MTGIFISNGVLGVEGFLNMASVLGKSGQECTCRLHNFPEDRIAMLDTAAEWSMVGGELAEELWSQLGEGEYFEMHARGHLRTGELRKCNVTLRADNGDDLTFEGTIFVSMDWTGPIVLGYHGLFENIRFALDPGLNSEQQRFYFGSCE